jgi:molybdopterin-guanine dinucleotide biosynthesis protein A
MFDAIVLAGGRAARLGGADKPALEVGGASLLDRSVAAVSSAGRVVVVGPEHPISARVTWCSEQPAGAGPVAAIAAGLALVEDEVVVVLAADLPWIAPAVPRLIAALGASDVAVLVDATGRRNYLAAAWRRRALSAAVDDIGGLVGAPARALFSGVDVVEVPDLSGWGDDCDTWDDLAEARRAHREGTAP